MFAIAIFLAEECPSNLKQLYSHITCSLRESLFLQRYMFHHVRFPYTTVLRIIILCYYTILYTKTGKSNLCFLATSLHKLIYFMYKISFERGCVTFSHSSACSLLCTASTRASAPWWTIFSSCFFFLPSLGMWVMLHPDRVNSIWGVWSLEDL